MATESKTRTGAFAATVETFATSPATTPYAVSLARVLTLLDDAFTAEEVAEAAAALRHHLAVFPEDAARDLGHGLDTRADAARERAAGARALVLTDADVQGRESLLRDTWLSIRGHDPAADPDRALRSLASARHRLAAWLARYPADSAIRDALMRVEEQESLAHELADALATT